MYNKINSNVYLWVNKNLKGKLKHEEVNNMKSGFVSIVGKTNVGNQA